MVALYLQTLLMLAAAYFVGAAVACIIRRSLSAARRAEVPTSRRVDPLPDAAQAAGPRFGRPSQAEPPRAPAPAKPAVAAAPVAAAKAPAQDLKRIALIDDALEAGLNKLGVTRYEQIAAWLKPDVQRIAKGLGLDNRISRENWIEQAQVLAKGGETHYARRRARGEAANAEPTPDEGERRAIASASAPPPAAQVPRPSTRGAAAVAADIAPAKVATAVSPPAAASPATPQPPPVDTTPARVAERAAFAIERRPEPPAQPAPQAAAGAMPDTVVPIRPAAAPARENLRRISGIDSQIDELLRSQGVTRYSDIAQWTPADLARFDRLVGSGGRIQQENWVEQAQILSRGGDTAFSRDYDRSSGAGSDGSGTPASAVPVPESAPSAPPPKPDLGSLRSLRGQDRSEEPGPEAALLAASQNKVVRSPASNDLKRIKGIGVLIENRLNAMGVTSYEQIAHWTADDIERISRILEFKERIKSEDWIGQARILMSGGTTEFSKRFDRGEIGTARYKN